MVQGGADETQALLDERFDLIFFTGGSRVGQIVLEKAARHLTPVVLELGGKSPCLVDRDASLEVAARRIAWARFSNAGQTCVAPDYVLVHEAVEREPCRSLRAAVAAFYGDDPRTSPDYCRIVNDRNFERLSKMLRDGEVVCGGRAEAKERYIAPTILRGVSPDAPVMREEIFGPIFPVLAVPSMDAAIEFVTDRPSPLALYVFSNDEETQHRVIDRTSLGNACINDVLMHMVVPEPAGTPLSPKSAASDSRASSPAGCGCSSISSAADATGGPDERRITVASASVTLKPAASAR